MSPADVDERIAAKMGDIERRLDAIPEGDEVAMRALFDEVSTEARGRH